MHSLAYKISGMSPPVDIAKQTLNVPFGSEAGMSETSAY